MNISAIKCTPIKPQASFKGENRIDNQELGKLFEVTDKLDNDIVQADSIKKPAAVVASVALAVLTAFLFGSKVVSWVRRAIPEITNPDSTKYFENYIKKGANKVKGVATNLQESNGKFSKVKHVIGKGIEKTEEIAKTVYKKVTNLGTSNLKNPGDIAAKKLENLGGAVATVTFVPSAMNADTDEDGVSDLCQRGVNAYTGTKSKISETMEGANIIGELLDALT